MKDVSKRIALNTIYLYVSSIVQLLLGLYMSRIILQALGVTDFGIYGVVGSIVVVLNFLSTAMGGASMRYLAFELGGGSVERRRTAFSAVYTAHLGLGAALFIFAETLGLWYLCCVMEIPSERVYAAHWVYQSSVVIAVLNIIQVPFSALITAHERLGFSSLWSSVGNLMRFLGVVCLLWITIDRLIAYAVIMFLFTVIIFMGYFLFCKKRFSDVYCKISHDRVMLKGILSFAGYSAFSSSSNMMRIQGNNLLINKFFGVVLNAAVSVSSMVSGYIAGFTMNIITAFRPQIIKKYAANDIAGMNEDMINCMKFCVAIFSFIAVPIFLETDYVFWLWLGTVPQFSELFCRISLVGSLFNLVGLVVIIGIQATDRVKVNSLAITFVTFLSLMVTFILLLSGLPSYTVFIVSVVADAIILWLSLHNIKSLISQFSLGKFYLFFFRLLAFMLMGLVVAYIAQISLPSSFMRLVLVTILYAITFGGLFWFYMLDRKIRKSILNRLIRTRHKG